jgi:small subunit ribosomal protein S17
MPRRTFRGQVVKDAMDKTVVVQVSRQIKHPLYGKFIKRSKKYLAHDEENICRVGQQVLIRECRPISKRKSWEICAEDNGIGAEAVEATS